MMQRSLDAESLVNVTYIDVLCQKLIGHSVLVEDVVVGASTCESGAEEETEYSIRTQKQ